MADSPGAWVVLGTLGGVVAIYLFSVATGAIG